MKPGTVSVVRLDTVDTVDTAGRRAAPAAHQPQPHTWALRASVPASAGPRPPPSRVAGLIYPESDGGMWESSPYLSIFLETR